MAFDDYNRFDGISLAGLVAAGDVSAAELIDEAIARTERANPASMPSFTKTMNAPVRLQPTGCRKARSPGVPFLLKDISLQAEGTPSRQVSRFWPPFPAAHDSYLMARFRRAGLIAFAQNQCAGVRTGPTTEGKLYGAAHNPWDLALSPGGSSAVRQRLSQRALCAGPCQRRRRFDPHSRRMLRPCRSETDTRRVSSGPDMPDSVDGLAI